jgi:hypothetical protein
MLSIATVETTVDGFAPTYVKAPVGMTIRAIAGILLTIANS